MLWIAELLSLIASICLLLLIINEAGFQLGRRHLLYEGRDADRGLGVIEGAVFALLGLLIALTFSTAAGRFESRRMLIADEANAISTSYLRLDLLGPELSAPIRPLYRDYVERRIADSGRADLDPTQPQALQDTEKLQAAIWSAVVSALEQRGQPALATPVLGPLNDMIDITVTRRMAAIVHPPAIVYLSLFLMAVLATFLAGHARGVSGRRSPIHTAVFIMAIGGTLYSIIELEYPRIGLVTIQHADVVLGDLRTLVK